MDLELHIFVKIFVIKSTVSLFFKNHSEALPFDKIVLFDNIRK